MTRVVIAAIPVRSDHRERGHGHIRRGRASRPDLHRGEGRRYRGRLHSGGRGVPDAGGQPVERRIVRRGAGHHAGPGLVGTEEPALAKPETRFTRSGTVDLAYQVIGDGPLDIVVVVGWVSHLEVLWELQEVAHFLDRFSAMGRVVIFDKRGTGLSDRPAEVPTYEQMVVDVLTVMDAAAVDRAVIVGWVDAGGIAMQVAATHPERVIAIVLGETMATAVPDAAHPWGPDPAVVEAVAEA